MTGWSGKKPPANQVPPPAGIYTGLRGQIFGLKPGDLGLVGEEAKTVWGALMEMGYPQGAASLVCLADGTTSLYFSTGGGILGGGQHRAVAQAGRDFLNTINAALPAFQPTREYPLPLVGQVCFYAITGQGVYTTSAQEDDLGHNRLPLAELYYAGQQVITQLRLHVPTGQK